MDTMEPRLESLLMRKTFEELNAEERIFVAASLTEESYNAYHFMMKHVAEGAEEDTLAPSAAIPERLKAHFEATIKPARIVTLSARHLSVAACLFLAVCLALVFFKVEKTAQPQPGLEQAKVETPTVEPEQKEKPAALPNMPMAGKPKAYVKTLRKIKPTPRVSKLAEAGLVETKDTTGVVSDSFYGLRVEAPLLGLDIDVNDQFLGLRIPGNVN